MLDKLKAWIEGLFQGITIRDDQGKGYLSTTPTIFDISPRRTLKHFDSGWIANQYTETIIPNGESWLIHGITLANGTRTAWGYCGIDPTRAETGATYNIGYRMPFAYQLPATLAGYPMNFFNSAAPILCPPGTRIWVNNIGFAGGDSIRLNIIYMRILEG